MIAAWACSEASLGTAVSERNGCLAVVRRISESVDGV